MTLVIDIAMIIPASGPNSGTVEPPPTTTEKVAVSGGIGWNNIPWT